MSWILDEAEVILRHDRYSTIRLPDIAAFAFEDATVVGFVIEYSTTTRLIHDWKPTQDKLLERFAASLRNSGSKAWNVYNVMLTEDESTEGTSLFALGSIEEDLRHTRKIPRQAVNTPADVRAALAPLLSISRQTSLVTDSFHARLAHRLESEIGPDAARLFLSEADEEAVARKLTENAQ
jgi:hypothetical protein